MVTFSAYPIFRGSQKPHGETSAIRAGVGILHRKVREVFAVLQTGSEAVHLWIHLIMKLNSADGMVTTEPW